MGDFLRGCLIGYELFSVAFTTSIFIVSIWIMTRRAKLRIEYPSGPAALSSPPHEDGRDETV